MPRDLENFIDGRWIASAAEEWGEVHNPATGEVLARHPLSTHEEVDRAVEAAGRAFPGWRETAVTDRAGLLFRFRQLLGEAADELADLIVAENGKPRAEAMGELVRAFQYVEHACAVPELLKGSISENVAGDVDTHYIREPLGTFVVVAPFNFPAMIPLYFTWAVGCGNTVVLKPSELCPLTTLRMTELASESGFPPGVVNVVLGGPGVVKQLAAHPGVAGVSFVGSSSVAEAVYQLASQHGKRAQCQGGAKNHLVVTETARLDACMDNLVNSAFGAASQRCFAGSNILVYRGIYDDFRARFLGAVKEIEVGNGAQPEVTMGPVISAVALERLRAAIAEAEQAGAKVLLDGRELKVNGHPEGFFLGPTVVEAEPGMAVFDEELFGPVRCLKAVEGLDEALALINGSRFGHSAAIYTEEGGTARRFARRAEVGQVGINVGTPAPIAFYPVGGRRASFFGSLRGRANDAVDFYTDKKVVATTWHGRP